MFEVGYDNVTVDGIAARAHASKATMYRSWPTKGALVAEALRRQSDNSTVIIVSDTGSLRGDLLAQMRLISALVTDHEDPSLINLLGALQTDHEFRELVRTQIEQSLGSMDIAIRRQADRRGEKKGALSVAAGLHVGIGQLLIASLLREKALDDDELHALVDDILLPLVAAHPTG